MIDDFTGIIKFPSDEYNVERSTEILWHWRERFDEITYTPFRLMDDFYNNLTVDDDNF